MANSESNDNPVKEAFFRALEIEGDERRAWLEANCHPAIREQVEQLLARHAEEPDTLDLSIWQVFDDGTDASEAETVLATGVMLDEFRMIRRLGEGGMGVVHLAEDTTLERLVAVKVLPMSSGFSEVAVARFRQEAVTVAQLNHPSIVPIHRVGRCRGVHYLVMDFIDGPTLASIIEDCRSDAPQGLPATDWVRTYVAHLADIGDALEHAHRNRVIHRDVKPSNIMLDAAGKARLTDFGIARNLRMERMTISGQLAGTVAYMSPEQARASQRGVDHRTDIYSLGATMYELLTLQRPFRGSSVEDIRQKVIWKQPRRVRQINPNIPVDLATICEKALEKDPAHRYQAASQIAADLRSFLDGRPILARPPSVFRRGRMWVRAHRTAALVAVIALLAVAVVVAVDATWRMRRQSMTQVVVTSDRPDARFTVQRLDSFLGTPVGAPVVVSKDAVDRWLDPGLYAISAVAPNGDFAEALRYVPGPDDRYDFREEIDRRDEPIEVALRLRVDTDVTAGMISIPGGTLETEHPLKDEPLAVGIEPFDIDRCEVSNGEYKAFVDATGHPLPFWWRDPGNGLGYDESIADLPVIGITQADAAAYAAWVGKRLPTEWEWEWAMRQPDMRLYPWGDETPDFAAVVPLERPASGRAEWDSSLERYIASVVPVEDDLGLNTPDGIVHANSNVSEMTATVRDGSGLEVIARGADFCAVAEGESLLAGGALPFGRVATYRGFRCVRSQ